MGETMMQSSDGDWLDHCPDTRTGKRCNTCAPGEPYETKKTFTTEGASPIEAEIGFQVPFEAFLEWAEEIEAVCQKYETEVQRTLVQSRGLKSEWVNVMRDMPERSGRGSGSHSETVSETGFGGRPVEQADALPPMPPTSNRLPGCERPEV
jgi:hypothetical protein